MTPRESHFIQNQELTLQALTLQTYGFAPLTRWCRDLQKGVLCSNIHDDVTNSSNKKPLITHQGLLLYFCSGGNLQKTFQLGLQKLSLLLLFE